MPGSERIPKILSLTITALCSKQTENQVFSGHVIDFTFYIYTITDTNEDNFAPTDLYPEILDLLKSILGDNLKLIYYLPIFRYLSMERCISQHC